MAALAGCGNEITGTVTAGIAGGGNGAPTIAELEKAGPLPERSMGRADAPVTMIEYASLGCPLCAHFHKTVFGKFKANYIDTGKVRFIYREFPIGASPAAAAQAARCVPDNAYFSINDKFMARRGQWNARNPDPDLLYRVVQDTGLSRAAFDSCMANQEIRDGINWVKLRGRELGVKGTPTFFFNGQQVRGALSYDEIRQIIDKHLASAAKPA
jgi:protein-disulfide isomerase